MDQQPLSVTELTRHIKTLLEEDLGHVLLKGEISNLATPRSGHVYFNLKDENAQIASVMFRSVAQRTRFELENGLEVVAFGRVTVYEPRGAYQIIIDSVEPLGSGALQLAFEQLKSKLAAEGLFDDDHKLALPYLPNQIGIVTSATGAAIRDMLNILSRRYPSIPVLIHPVPVQGDFAASAIAAAIGNLHKQPGIDLIIIGRGGGSVEDLWAFNEEVVARAIYRSTIPIISAVGHETDFTIADFVADLRAPTPSAAAELAVPLQDELVDRVNEMTAQLYRATQAGLGTLRERIETKEKRLRSPLWRIQGYMQKVDELVYRSSHEISRQVTEYKTSLDKLRQLLLFHSPKKQIEKKQYHLDELSQRLSQSLKEIIDNKTAKLTELSHVLDSASPLAVLKRGYAAVTNPEGAKITSTRQVNQNDHIRLDLSDGYLESEVTRVTRRAAQHPPRQDPSESK